MLRHHERQQVLERHDVALAIVEDFFRREPPAPGAVADGLLQFLLLDGTHGVEAEVGQRAEQAGAGWCAPRWSTFEPIGAVAELDEEIEDPLRHWPVERAIAAKLGGRVVGDEQDVGPRRVGWRLAQI